MKVVDFRKERDFGDVLNITFTFIRENYLLLGKSLLFILGPVTFLASLGNIGFLSSALSPDVLLDPTEDSALETIGILGLFYLLSAVAGVLMMVVGVLVVYSFMVLYQDYGPAGFTVSDVWANVKSNFGAVFWTMLVLILLFVLSYGLIFVPIFLGSMAGSGAGIALMSALFILVWLFAFIYYGVALSLVFPMRMREQVGAWESVRRSIWLVRDNWLSTFSIVFVSMIIYGVIASILSVPAYMLMFLETLHAAGEQSPPWYRLPLMAGSLIGSSLGSLLYSIPLLAIGFQYFNLVEKKEKIGLKQRIEKLSDEESL